MRPVMNLGKTLAELRTGDKIREPQSGVVFLVAEHGHSGWPCTTLITDCIVANACYDAAEPEARQKFTRKFGNSAYHLANIHQWLNADEEDWYRPSHPQDTAPEAPNTSVTDPFFSDTPDYPEVMKFKDGFDYAHKAGFLTWFPKDFLAALVKVRIPFVSVEDTGLVVKQELLASVFLPSLCEIGCGEGVDPDTVGERFKLFDNPIYRFAAPDNRVLGLEADYDYRDVNWWFLTRTSAPRLYGYVCRVSPGYRGGDDWSEQVQFCRCCCASGVRPMVNIQSGMPISEEPDEDGIYSFRYLPTGTPFVMHDMRTIAGAVSQTLGLNPRIESKFNPGCVCTNSSCIRQGMCDSCWQYHDGPASMFQPTCQLNHKAVPMWKIVQCFDEYGILKKKFHELD